MAHAPDRFEPDHTIRAQPGQTRFPLETGRKTRIVMPSAIDRLVWDRAQGTFGGTVTLEGFTVWVGHGARAEVRFTDARGRRFGKETVYLFDNVFRLEVEVPHTAQSPFLATVRLPDHGLEQTTPPLPLADPVVVRNCRWDRHEAREGEPVRLEAQVAGAPEGTPAYVQIYRFDPVWEAHEELACLRATVAGGGIQAVWSARLPGNPWPGIVPEYFFRVDCLGQCATTLESARCAIARRRGETGLLRVPDLFADLVDCAREVKAVVHTMREAGRLFLTEVRQFSEPSIVEAAMELAEAEGIVVLRHDAVACPTPRLLAEAVVAAAARRLLPGPPEHAAQHLPAFFGALRPQVRFDPLGGTFRVSLPVETPAQEARLLLDALDGVNRLAAGGSLRVAILIDGVQHLLEQGSATDGQVVEGQLQAAFQRHDHLAYVLAGSATRRLRDRTAASSRPLYRLGTPLFVEPLPREELARRLRRGFGTAGMEVTPAALDALLDLSEEMPDAAQRLARACWNWLRGRQQQPLTADDVHAVLEQLVRQADPLYTQTWNRLPTVQQQALWALAESAGRNLFDEAALRPYGLTPDTTRLALDALVQTAVVWLDETPGGARYRLTDPFFASWLRLIVAVVLWGIERYASRDA